MTILPIKNENKRNYYINLYIENNLSKRELEWEIKNNSYERLEHKPDKIDIVVPTSIPSITSNFKNPILLNLNGKEIKSESDLEKLIYSQLNYVFLQLGNGFMWVGNQYKIRDGNKNYFIDMLLYNIKYNCYMVVEIKCRNLKKKIIALIGTFVISYLVSKFLARKVNKINMVSSLKSNE